MGAAAIWLPPATEMFDARQEPIAKPTMTPMRPMETANHGFEEDEEEEKTSGLDFVTAV